MSARTGTPFLQALLAELPAADDGDKRELASQLRPFLADDPGRLLDADEKAQQLGLHPDTVVRMARAGRIWAKKVGREWRFRADLCDILPAGGGPSPAPAALQRRRPVATAPASFAAIRGRS